MVGRSFGTHITTEKVDFSTVEIPEIIMYNGVEVEDMLYDANNPILRIVNVAHMRWTGGAFDVKPREHSAIAFRISGDAVISNSKGKYYVNPNDILYLPQNMGYLAEYTDTEMIVIHFVTARDDDEIEVHRFQNGEQLYKLFLRALDLWTNKKPGFAVYALAELYKILGCILEQKAQTNMPPSFLRAISFINANYADNSLSTGMVCEAAGIGATVFRQLFRKYYQKTPTEYITDLRLERARNLISGGMSIEDAAYESGFNDPKYFARVVKKYFHCTPRELKAYGK